MSPIQRNICIAGAVVMAVLALVSIALLAPSSGATTNESSNYWSPHWWLVYVTVVLVAATSGLMCYTAKLWDATRTLLARADLTARFHERAYIVGGGPTGFSPEGPPKMMFNNAGEMIFTERAMTIENWGRTPGFVTSIQWGICRKDELPPNMSISEIIHRNTLPIRRVEFAEQIYPPTSGVLLVRHVVIPTDENIGKVFFGRIDYKDVFRERHHSTFKLLMNNGPSDPLQGSYSEDWS